MKRKGITQYNLYKDYGISRAQVQRLKKNESVTTHTLDMLCRILTVNFQILLNTGKENETMLSFSDNET